MKNLSQILMVIAILLVIGAVILKLTRIDPVTLIKTVRAISLVVFANTLLLLAVLLKK